MWLCGTNNPGGGLPTDGTGVSCNDADLRTAQVSNRCSLSTPIARPALDVCGIAHGGVFGCRRGRAEVVVHNLLLNARFVRRSDNGGNMGAPTEYREEAAELVHAGAYGPQLLEDLQHRLPRRVCLGSTKWDITV